MYGYADFKSHVTRRDEKGMFGVPLKRLLLSGLGGGMALTISKFFADNLSIFVGVIAFIALIVLTAPKGGIPRWKNMLYDWRWRLMSAAVIAPTSLLGQVGLLLDLPVAPMNIDAEKLFRPDEEIAPRTTLTDWVTFSALGQTDGENGLILATSPGLKLDD